MTKGEFITIRTEPVWIRCTCQKALITAETIRETAALFKVLRRLLSAQSNFCAALWDPRWTNKKQTEFTKCDIYPNGAIN